jgi:hypothetical protein
MVQLPGLNTPQFTWVRVRGLTRRPRPVAPVFQPEVAARGIVHAAAHPGRRELKVGGSTVMTITGNTIAPWFADWYLARTNVQAQQTDEPLDPDAGDYLFEPVDEDRGAHGPFDDEAKDRSLQLTLTTHRGLVRGGLAAAAAAAAAGVVATRRR